MKAEHAQIFRELDPPAGGAARMRAKLAAGGHLRRFQVWWLGPVAVALVAAIAVVNFRGATGPDQASDSLLADSSLDRLLGRTAEPVETRVTRGTMPVAVNQIQTSNPRIRFYTLDPAQPESADSAPDELL
jgi:hypothetical protein